MSPRASPNLKSALGADRAKHLALDETEIDANLGELSTAKLLEIQDQGRTALRSIPDQADRARRAEAVQHHATSLANFERQLADTQDERAQLRWHDRKRRADLDGRIVTLELSVGAHRNALAESIERAAEFDYDRWLENNEMQIVEATAADRELAIRRADAYWRAIQTVWLDADPKIERRLGERPENPADRERWERAAAAQESYRHLCGELPDLDADKASLAGRQLQDFKQAIELAKKFAKPPTPDLDRGPTAGSANSRLGRAASAWSLLTTERQVSGPEVA